MATKKAVTKKAVAKKATAKKIIAIRSKDNKHNAGSISTAGKKAPTAKKAVAKKNITSLLVDKDIKFVSVANFSGTPLFGWSGGDNVDRFARTLKSLSKEQIHKLYLLDVSSSESEDYIAALGAAYEAMGNVMLLEDLTEEQKNAIILRTDSNSYQETVSDDFYELDLYELEWRSKWDDLMPKGLNKKDAMEYKGAIGYASQVDMALRASQVFDRDSYNILTKPWRKYVGALRSSDRDIYQGI